MNIHWGELLQVFGATVAATALLVTVFTLGVRGMAKNAGAKKDGESSGAAIGSDAGPVLCFVLSFVIVIYGVYLIVAK
jgi:hypothetical protein